MTETAVHTNVDISAYDKPQEPHAPVTGEKTYGDSSFDGDTVPVGHEPYEEPTDQAKVVGREMISAIRQGRK